MERDCPHKGKGEKEKEEATINSLFVEVMAHKTCIPIDVKEGFEIVPYNVTEKYNEEPWEKVENDDYLSSGSWEKLDNEQTRINEREE